MHAKKNTIAITAMHQITDNERHANLFLLLTNKTMHMKHCKYVQQLSIELRLCKLLLEFIKRVHITVQCKQSIICIKHSQWHVLVQIHA